MTAAPVSRSVDDARLHELGDELARRGIAVGDPAEGAPVALPGIAGAWCEIGLLDTGELTWTCLPYGESPRPVLAVRVALALLGTGPPTPEPSPALDPRMFAAGSLHGALAALGLTVAGAAGDHGDGAVSTEIVVTNPAAPARGRLRLIGMRELRWECRLPSGAAARAIAAALGHAAPGG